MSKTHGCPFLPVGENLSRNLPEMSSGWLPKAVIQADFMLPPGLGAGSTSRMPRSVSVAQ